MEEKPNMAKVSLAKAFVVRSRLKSKIDFLSNSLLLSEVTHLASSVYEDGNNTMVAAEAKPATINGLSLDETYLTFIKGSGYLAVLNSAIDETNAVSSRKILNEIQTIKRQYHVTERFSNQVEKAQLKSVEYDSRQFNALTKETGCKVTHFYKLDTSLDYKKLGKELKKKLEALEDELSEQNIKQKVEIPDEILEFVNE